MNKCPEVKRRPAMSSSAIWSATVVVVVCGWLSGCGPVQSTQGINEAAVDFERARVVDAHQKAPYEYYSAKYYLHKAKEEWGYSDFEAAYDYARQAKQAAGSAILKAKEDPWSNPVDEAKQDEALRAADKADESAGEKGPQGF